MTVYKTPLQIALAHPRGLMWAGKQVSPQGIVTHKINGSECMAYVRAGYFELTSDLEGRRCYRLTQAGRALAEKDNARQAASELPRAIAAEQLCREEEKP